MADILADGKIRIFLVPTIANMAAPTTTEIAAGTELTKLVTFDGMIGFEADTAYAESTPIDGKYDTMMPDRVSFSNPALRLKKQTGTDTAHITMVYGYAAYLVIRRDVDSATAIASGDKVEVYQIACGETKRLNVEKNTVARYEVPLGFTPSQPNLRATVA
jgi:hypothetical protein